MTFPNLPTLFRREGLLPVNSMFEKAFKDFFPEESMDIVKHGFPKVNLIDENDKVIIIAEIAGVEKKDIKIQYKDNILSISGEKKDEFKTEKPNYITQELRNGYFCRQIKINENLVNAEEISALYNNGVLKIEIPKREVKEDDKGLDIKIK